jgi:hypothetical protein
MTRGGALSGVTPGLPRVAIHVYLRHLLALVEGDAVRGREALSRHVRPIVTTPETDGPRRGYGAAGVFNLSSVRLPFVRPPSWREAARLPEN